jgi:membrane-associated protein
MMDLLQQFVDLFLHLDKHLTAVVNEYHTLTYIILFAIIFAETGLVVIPFLPGDSLLFMAGSLCALPNAELNVWYLGLALFAAAFLGDTLNYAIGKAVGPRAFSGKVPFLKQSHLEQTQAFFAKYGGKTIVMARFVPIVRTFAPFVAGVGTMAYRRFISYNFFGALLWVGAGLAAGYAFGNIDFVKKNFSLVVLAIVVISLLPIAFEALKARGGKPAQPASGAA